MEQVKLLSMTAILTVLIWISADSMVNETVPLSVVLEPVPAPTAPGLLVEPPEPGQVYEVQVAGPRRIVEDIQARPAPLHARFKVAERPTGSAEISIDRATLKAELAEQWHEFRNLTVVAVDPPTLAVAVDHRITREVDIVLKTLTLAYDVEPQLSRSTATVRMRESRLAERPAGQPLQIDVAADAERLLHEAPLGERATIHVTLDSTQFGPDAELNPPAVDVTAKLKARRITERVPTVPVLLAVSFANLEKAYRPATRDGSPLALVTQTLAVTGPPDEVTKLVRGTSRAYGVIQLKEEDLEQLGVLKLMTPEYHFPPGIVLAEEPQPIEFKLIKASEAEDSP
ncbi:MAG: hypothetical protein PVI86_08485 [Phycisphaerae bacterium]|jgi:hypothetical protein